MEPPEDVMVQEIMTKNVAVIDQNATIQVAAMILRKRNIHGLVIVKGKNVIGVLTDKDIISKVVAENKSPLTVKVKDVMAPKVIVVKPTETIDEATRIMFANDVSRLPVVDEMGTLVGIITMADMIRVYPGITEIFEEEQDITDPQTMLAERTTIEGRCEECDIISEDLVEIDSRWLCNDCSEAYTSIGSKRREF